MAQVDESQLTLLVETTDPVELAFVQGLLDGADITFVVQAEHHHRLEAGLFGNPAIAPRVLVRVDQLERARGLLEARAEAPEVCAVHGSPATSRCARCEAALCADCGAAVPAICEVCSAGRPRPFADPRRRQRLRKVIAWAMLSPLLVSSLALLVVLVLRAFGVLPPPR